MNDIKDSHFASIIKLKCPRCHEGDLYTHGSGYNFRDFTKMPERCPVCGQKYMLEPGFWYGAMYFAYGFGVFISLPVFLIFYLVTHFTFYQSIGAVLMLQLLLTPLIFRYSRSVWIHIFVSYRGLNP